MDYREFDESFGLTAMAEDVFVDIRTGTNVQHSMTALLRQSVYGRTAGYDDVNDADRLRVDPTMRTLVGGRAVMRHAASTSQMARFETTLLADEVSSEALMALPGCAAWPPRWSGTPWSVKHWSLTTLREKLIKTGAKAVRHARYVTFQMAEVAIPRRLFAAILRRIVRLRPVPV